MFPCLQTACRVGGFAIVSRYGKCRVFIICPAASATADVATPDHFAAYAVTGAAQKPGLDDFWIGGAGVVRF